MSLFGQRSIGAILVAVLTALPVSGSLCAALCAPIAHQTAEAAGHGAHATTRVSHDPSDGPALTGAPGHDCTRHDGRAGAALAAASTGRAETSLVRLPHYAAPSAIHPLGLKTGLVRPEWDAPTGSSPPTRTPLVLRI